MINTVWYCADHFIHLHLHYNIYTLISTSKRIVKYISKYYIIIKIFIRNPTSFKSLYIRVHYRQDPLYAPTSNKSTLNTELQFTRPHRLHKLIEVIKK